MVYTYMVLYQMTLRRSCSVYILHYQ